MGKKAKAPSRMITVMQELPRRLNSEQAAAYLGLTVRNLKNLRLARKISYYRVGQLSIAFDRAELDRFLSSRFVERL